MSGTQFAYDCPHCITKGAGFTVAYQWHSRLSSDCSNILAICGVCNLGVTISARAVISTNFPDMLNYQIAFPSDLHELLKSWPALKLESPESTPENIAKFFLRGVEGIQNRHWDAAGAMFRKTLDVTTKSLAPDHRNLSLYARINKLVELGLLTSAMGEWAHEIRLDGNDAVHDEEPETERDARSSRRFTEAVLTYAYTLPNMVQSNRINREAARTA